MIRRLLLILVSAALFALCFPDGPLPLLAFICLVPFGLALERTSARTGLFLGGVCGFCFWVIAAWWLANGFYFYVTLPRTAAWLWTLAGCLLAAVPYAAFGALCGRFGWMRTFSGRIRAAAALTVLLSWYPFLFPGNYVHSLYAMPPVVQVVDLGGVPLLLFLVNMINFFLAGAVLGRSGRRGFTADLSAALLAGFLMVVYGLFRLHGLHQVMAVADDTRRVRVVSVQPDLPLRRAGVPYLFGETGSMNDLDALLTLSAEGIERFPDADVIVWPELPSGISCNPDNGLLRAAGELAGQSGIPFIINCYDPVDAGDYNTALLIRPNGAFGPGYRKRILLPFGEYLPGEKRLPWLRRLFPRALHYIPGDGNVRLLPVGGGRRGIPTLCYEVLFSGHVREFVAQGGDVIINLVDDVWFGESPASAIHMALAVFRAVEFRLPLVRVTNSGNGVFVQPTGEIVKGSRTPTFTPLVTSFSLFVPPRRSLYAACGNAFLIFLTVVWIGETAVKICLKRFNKGVAKN
jgi:apolipoprotein N-acyltransferase